MFFDELTRQTYPQNVEGPIDIDFSGIGALCKDITASKRLTIHVFTSLKISAAYYPMKTFYDIF